MGPNFLAENQSCLYPHMRAKFGCDPTAVSKKVPFNFISRYVGISQIFILSEFCFYFFTKLSDIFAI